MEAYFKSLAAQFTHPVTAVAQILGFIPIILAYFIFRKNSRKTSITIKAVSDLISAVHFCLLRQWTGFVINCINTFRGVCFCQRGKKAWASGIWIPIIFCTATVIGGLFGWTGPKSLLAIVGTCLGVVGYWCKTPGQLRKFNLAGVFLWIIYGTITLSVPTVISNVIALVSIVLTEIRVMRQEKEQPHEAV